MTFIDSVLKIWATCALITFVSWVILYIAFQEVGGDEISFIVTLSLGVLVTLAVLVAGNHLKKQL
jgi:hypothetical protein